MDAHPEAGGLPNGSLRFAENGRLLASTVDRAACACLISRERPSRIAGTGAKNFNAVAITDDATGFAAITSATESGKIGLRRRSGRWSRARGPPGHAQARRRRP